MCRADVISEIPSPGRADAAGQPEAIVLHFVQARPGHDATDLRFFSESQQVGHHSKMFAAPVPARDAHPGLHLVKNEQHLVLLANLPEQLEEFAPEMVIAAFTLDRFNDDRRNMFPFLCQNIADLFFGESLFLNHGPGALVRWQGKINARVRDPRPGELGEEIGLPRLSIGKADGIPRSSMKRALEMHDFRPALTLSD